MDQISANSAGNRTGLGAIDCPAVLASGITLAMANNGVDYNTTVGEKSYVISAVGGFCLLSLTGVTSVAANIEYVCGDEQTIVMHVPYGKTTLYAESDTDSTNLYIRELVVQSL